MTETIKDDLYKSVQEEGEAAYDYRQRKRIAESVGDSETARLYEHIAQEEDRHQMEFIKRKDALETEMEIIRKAPTELEETTDNLLPMPPKKGPPLPKALGLTWPWGTNGKG